jgi:hypothetical protein
MLIIYCEAVDVLQYRGSSIVKMKVFLLLNPGSGVP